MMFYGYIYIYLKLKRFDVNYIFGKFKFLLVLLISILKKRIDVL